MKKRILTATAVFCAIIAYGQDESQAVPASGKITYEEKVKLEIKIEGDGAAMADMLPRERIIIRELLFSDGCTLFRQGRATGEDMPMGGGHSEGVRIRMVGAGESKIFTDVADRKVTEQRDFMNRIFIVERDLPGTKWKITGNNKEILGYKCMEAVASDTAGRITRVWFAPEFGARGGPALLSDLPGMVLAADINDGRRTYIATSVDPLGKEEMKLARPSEGKKVTEEEYQAIVEEKMKEMGVERGSGGGHMQVVIKR